MQLSTWRLNGFQLKFIALILMVIDHVYQYFPNIPISFNWIGRIVAPIFFYLMVEGFRHTRNRARYILRMWIAAVVMAVGSQLLMQWMPQGLTPITNNIFLSLALALLMLQAWEWYLHSKHIMLKMGSLLLILFTIVGEILSEANWYGVAMTLIFYSLHQHRLRMVITYICTILLLSIGMNAFILGFSTLNWHSLFFEQYQWLMIGAGIPILMYNGKRGYNAPWANYAFYLVYPLHMWAFYILASSAS